MLTINKIGILFAFLSSLGLSVNAVGAENSLPVGTVISADNYDAIKDKIFEDKRVGDMITERMELMFLLELSESKGIAFCCCCCCPSIPLIFFMLFIFDIL